MLAGEVGLESVKKLDIETLLWHFKLVLPRSIGAHVEDLNFLCSSVAGAVSPLI